MSGELALLGDPGSCRTTARALRRVAHEAGQAERTTVARGVSSGWGAQSLDGRLTVDQRFSRQLSTDAAALAGGLETLADDLDAVHRRLRGVRHRLAPLGLVAGDDVVDPRTRPATAGRSDVVAAWHSGLAEVGVARRHETQAQQAWETTLRDHTHPDDPASWMTHRMLPVTAPGVLAPAVGPAAPLPASGHRGRPPGVGHGPAVAVDSPIAAGSVVGVLTRPGRGHLVVAGPVEPVRYEAATVRLSPPVLVAATVTLTPPSTIIAGPPPRWLTEDVSDDA